MSIKRLTPFLGALMLGPGCFVLLLLFAWARYEGYSAFAWIIGVAPVVMILAALARLAAASRSSGEKGEATPDPRD
ncbi:hypothetical protein BI312_19045 [Xanthomonas citri pv. citri]|nr:hypothetical protein XAC29_05370 [Xanthomonas axonopodis Xac29-1]APR11975.1 hypothetical protein BI314_19250 [Xanthomonas citri pv. citri]APR16592.1 hypothetical protein BI315_18975 [Xanthomonas citri pv. citri]APR19335.1 hypothetical protein BI316_07045 [Xanthomonas citri pv. citri]APR24644.1 hypothetical protein BJD09_10935 [Xanthomonas citri pv. citri]